jgi:hypothetical protein
MQGTYGLALINNSSTTNVTATAMMPKNTIIANHIPTPAIPGCGFIVPRVTLPIDASAPLLPNTRLHFWFRMIPSASHAFTTVNWKPPSELCKNPKLLPMTRLRIETEMETSKMKRRSFEKNSHNSYTLKHRTRLRLSEGSENTARWLCESEGVWKATDATRG